MGKSFAGGELCLTNLAQLTPSNAPDFSVRREVAVRVDGWVEVGGTAGVVVRLAGADRVYLLPSGLVTQPLERGRRFSLQGRCLAEGTNLLLNTQPLVQNDGLHMRSENMAGLWLEPGRHAIRIRYFNRTGDRELAVRLAGPGEALQPIAPTRWWRATTNTTTGTVAWSPGLDYTVYDGAWNQLPDFSQLIPVEAGVTADCDLGVARRADNFGLVFNGFLEVTQPGFYRIACSSDDGSDLCLGQTHLALVLKDRQTVTPLPRLSAGQATDDRGELYAAELEGVVMYAAKEEVGLKLELASGHGRANAYLPADMGVDPQWLAGARVRVAGMVRNRLAPEGYHVAAELRAGALENLHVLEVPKSLWDARPLQTLATLTAGEPVRTNTGLLHVQGQLEGQPGQWWLRDATARVALTGLVGEDLPPAGRVELMGRLAPATEQSGFAVFAWRQLSTGTSTNGELPLLTAVEEVKRLTREEAKRGYPVKVSGVITFVWPDAGFFLQDATWSIDVRMGTNLDHEVPRIGEYWEVSGETFAEFAPDILVHQARRIGAGALPEPLHPNWTELVDGSLDTQYIEIEGVVLAVEGQVIRLQTAGGSIRIKLPETANDMLVRFQGALVRVRGCLIPGRDINTQQVKLGEFELRNSSVAVMESAPADPFTPPVKHPNDLYLFDAHASPVQRAQIHGMVLQQRDGILFVLDRTNGVRVIPETAATFQPGDLVAVVGFPDLTGPAPVFNSALVRRIKAATLPPPIRLMADHLVDGSRDATLAVIEGSLISQRISGSDQILEVRSGTHPWLARLAVRGGELPPLAVGSLLQLSGVYAGQGGDRARGREIDTFELLLNTPDDVYVLKRPSWWTARHALTVAGVLLAILLLAVIWIGALSRQVEERTRALKSEIEDHKRTELELERKTLQLTREIEERLRIEAEVERGHKQLLVTSRLAGMAEVATSVLHNVGNVMTSVNVLSASIVDLVRKSKIASVARVGELLSQNRENLDQFIQADERGRKLPDYVSQLGTHLAEEQSSLLTKVQVLNENIHHINEIVAMQQTYAKVSGVLETIPPADVVEDALRMHGESLKRHGIALVKEYEPLGPVTMDRHKILQILFNLLENAKYACLQGKTRDKQIVIRLHSGPGEFVTLSVSDNGMGIPPENLERIFGQGFSTRKDGHGFGLHSSILAAQDMGGGLYARSTGLEQGATFTLELPRQPKFHPPVKH